MQVKTMPIILSILWICLMIMDMSSTIMCFDIAINKGITVRELNPLGYPNGMYFTVFTIAMVILFIIIINKLLIDTKSCKILSIIWSFTLAWLCTKQLSAVVNNSFTLMRLNEL